jgi:hypothetical protein
MQDFHHLRHSDVRARFCDLQQNIAFIYLPDLLSYKAMYWGKMVIKGAKTSERFRIEAYEFFCDMQQKCLSCTGHFTPQATPKAAGSFVAYRTFKIGLSGFHGKLMSY